MDRRPTKQGKPVVRVRLDGRDKLPSQNHLNVKLKAAIKALESRPRREVTQADLDSYARVNKTERKANDAMDGFEDSTRMRYSHGGVVGQLARKVLEGRQQAARIAPALEQRQQAALTGGAERKPGGMSGMLGQLARKVHEGRQQAARIAPALPRPPRELDRMDGFEDSTRMRYSHGGEVSGYAKGGAAAATAVNKHERNLHKGETPTKLAKGGSAPVKKAMGGDMSMPAKKAMGGALSMPAKKRGVPVASREPMIKR